jgi:hypothetical protein
MVQNPNPMPPSEPRAPAGPVSRVSLEPIGLDPPARVQMIVALVLGLLLVAIPLYLWRRPRAEEVLGAGDDNKATAQPAYVDAGPAATEPHLGAGGPVALADPMVLECHDPGSKRTSADQCDHLAAFEKAFAKAIEDAATCVPTSAGGGALPFVADVSFGRKKNPIAIALGKEGRTIKSPKTGSACLTAVRKGIPESVLDSQTHAHSRYKIQLVATYPAAAK